MKGKKRAGKIRHQLDRLHTLIRLNQLISSSLDMERVLQAITRAAGTLMEAPFVSFWLVDRTTQTLELRAFSNEQMGASWPKDLWKLPFAQGGVGWVAKHQSTLQVPDVFLDDRIVNRTWWKRHGLHSFLGIPVSLGNTLLAVMALDSPQPLHLDTDAQALLDGFVSQAAIAIQNAQLYDQVQCHARNLEQYTHQLLHRQEALQAVYQMATTLENTFDTMCAQVATHLAQLLQIPHVLIQEPQDERLQVVSHCVDDRLQREKDSLFEGMPWAAVYTDGQLYQVTGELRQLFPAVPYFASYQFQTLVSVPVKNKAGQVIGNITLLDYRKRTLSREDLQLVEIFASYIAYTKEWETMKRELQRSHEMEIIGQLTAGVAHEVRNPLTAILAITEALFQDLGDIPAYQPYLAHIRAQVDRLSKLMQDLLHLGRPRQASTFQREFLGALCASAIDIWRRSPAGQHHTVSFQQSSDNQSLEVLTESPQLHQALFNLLDNAAQHSPPGSNIRVVLLPPHHSFFRIQITDQGSGIPPAYLSRVFDPFFTTRKQGTGLGLSLVKRIIENHGGQVILWNNDPPPGCTVEIQLPPAGE